MEFTKISTVDVITIATALGTSLLWSFLGYGVYKVVVLVYGELTTPLRHLPGPSSNSLIFGNFNQIQASDCTDLVEGWIENYGTTLRYNGLLNIKRIFTADLKALSHVFKNSYDYQKPVFATYNVRRVLGRGLVFVEGDVHKVQRKIMNPAFGPQHMRELSATFIDKSIQLRDMLAAEIARDGDVSRIDAVPWLSRVTLDIIGLSGFNYDFNSLENGAQQTTNELGNAFAVLFKTGTAMSKLTMLKSFFPITRFLPDRALADEKVAHDIVDRIGLLLLRDSKASVIAEQHDLSGELKGRRDVLTVMVRANATPGLPADKRMTDQDVLAQLPTLFVAGHETTSIGIAWGLYVLTQHKDIQRKLREELLSVTTDRPTMDELNGLPYLDKFVREVLRLHPPAPTTVRAAVKDDVLPLSKPFTDAKGNVHHELRITKGDTIMISISAMNRAKWIWGEDSMEFKPERWDNVPDTATGMPGVWSNTLTFIGGARACIGYRFAIAGMKFVLFTLVRAFEFDLAVPAEDIVKRSNLIQRTILATAPRLTANQLPLLVRPVSNI